MSLGEKALNKSITKHRFKFDDRAFVIRRNLMVASSLALAAAFVSPLNGGQYEVNVGIVKGVVSNPVLLYLFLAAVCIYYIAWFYIHCQSLVVNNYFNIARAFSSELSQLTAAEKFKEFLSEQGPQNQKAPTPSFRPKGVSMTSASLTGSLNAHSIRNHPHLGASLQGSQNFNVNITADGIDVDYEHDMVEDDLVYLNTHKDLYWRTRRDEWFIVVLPLVFAAIGLSAVGVRILTILWGQPTT